MSPAAASPDIDSFIARWTAREGGADSVGRIDLYKRELQAEIPLKRIWLLVEE